MALSTSHLILTTTIHNFSSCKTETLYLLNNNSSFLPPPAPGNHHSVFWFYEFDCPKSHIWGLMLYLSFCDFISLGIMSSNFNYVVACVSIFFLFKAG